ncbi:unnamed protein product [Mycena citricolor]|uniref:Metallo-beta-lactamase domain-containing protein n=1 Tax=Mycena citricolor TaxID=2018698 RepID=A0AAD2HRN8_9AGAR|nr:unnamed protein product [Mycena citricolor]
MLATRSAIFLSLVSSTLASFHDFGIPYSDATVNVRAFKVTGGYMTGGASAFLTPVVPGHENIPVSMYAFLVEHNGTRIMIDLGLQSDPENLPPTTAAYFSNGFAKVADVAGGIPKMLVAGGISLQSINAVMWSHAQFDHIDADFAGRKVTKIDFSKNNITFGGLQALDYFGDGSFYLMNTPGHMSGHLTTLARTTSSSFIVLSGDTYHHSGQLRPRPELQVAYPCPGELVEAAKSGISTDYFWSPDSELDPVTSRVSLDKIASFDADPDFLVVVAHDTTLDGLLPVLPAYLNQCAAEQYCVQI